MSKRTMRDVAYLFWSICFGIIYLPHFFIYLVCSGVNSYVKSDLERMRKHINIRIPLWLSLFFFLHNNSYFRRIFYCRIGPVLSLLIGWYRPGNKYFSISYTTKIGKGMLVAHPYATILNAESIGDNFTCTHCTTIGSKCKKRPVIGDNVSIGCHACIIGGVHIGNNVIIGAGSVVVKDIPDNCVVAGNPAKVIRYI